jgi:rod shape-determining protein MreD
MHLFSLQGITPDILAIWVIYLALKEGQLYGTIWGFSIGLLFDLSTANFIGLSALTKTICGFLAGYFHNENKTRLTLGSYRFLLIVLFTSLIHNIVYFVIFTQGTEIGLLRTIFQFSAITTLYTATFSLLPMFAFSRRYIG